MLTAIYAILIFLVLITVHEFGHFITAKKAGITVHEFAIGMGPAIFKKEKNGTLYSLRVFPLGGYCALEGEDGDSDDENAFCNKSVLKRFVVLFAGAAMNIITGFLVFVIIFFNVSAVNVPVVNSLMENYPASDAGLMVGDRITKVNGTRINIQQDLSFELSRYKGGEIEVEYERDGKRGEVSITPKQSEDGTYLIGFVTGAEKLGLISRIKHAFYYTLFMSKVVIVSFYDLITGAVSIKLMSGPVGIVNEINTAAKSGILDVLSLMGLISVNLGIFNLLPLPALDGGRLLFLLIEAVRRKKLPAEKEGMVHFIGFALLILLMLFATFNDITRIFAK